MSDKKDVKGYFKVISKTKMDDLASGALNQIGESDLCLTNSTDVIQFEYVKPQEDEKIQIEPGSYLLSEGMSGVELKKFEIKKRNLLNTVTSTATIMNEAKTFFSRLHIYEKLNRPKKRGILLYSSPGCGKSSSIEKISLDMMEEDPGTVVMVWPSSEIEADAITRFLTYRSDYSAACSKMILIIEDIGGGEREGSSSRNAVDSGMLNLLDGVGLIFKLPTFIIATTNYPENLLSALCDRPGRFDKLVKLQPPSHKEKIELMEFISKRELSQEEKDALGDKKVADFSIAHLEEVIVRSELHDKSYIQVIKELVDHKTLFKNDFEDKNSTMGIGIGND